MTTAFIFISSLAGSEKIWNLSNLQTLSGKLSWSHYCLLLAVSDPGARCFYEKETIACNWSVRQLDRQINSMLYERLALSRDKKGVLKLTNKGKS